MIVDPDKAARVIAEIAEEEIAARFGRLEAGDVVLSLMLRDRGLMPEPPPRADAVVIPVGDELTAAARDVTERLRRRHCRRLDALHGIRNAHRRHPRARNRPAGGSFE